ncbi:hypothetical protein D9V41_16125 [Aeromicrobium phragmitis]|uniref:Uncharacterized protein n=1 Tax=Aeromicrobium phragmitis TaxID=2478914 RepID=A0A3L8PF36_9ACTN|nr:hypothetical protein D9V41_16125 [Aeromicrobium phragmitis]
MKGWEPGRQRLPVAASEIVKHAVEGHCCHDTAGAGETPLYGASQASCERSVHDRAPVVPVVPRRTEKIRGHRVRALLHREGDERPSQGREAADLDGRRSDPSGEDFRMIECKREPDISKNLFRPLRIRGPRSGTQAFERDRVIAIPVKRAQPSGSCPAQHPPGLRGEPLRFVDHQHEGTFGLVSHASPSSSLGLPPPGAARTGGHR